MFFTLLSASTVAALQTVGAFLVICMVVTPGATAYLLTDRFPRLLVIAVAIGAVDQLHRRLCELFPRRRDGRHHRRACRRWSFLAAFFLAPKHGMLAARRRADPGAGGGRHDARSTRCSRPSSSSSCVNALIISVLVARADGAALLLPRPQGLVADGRRDLATPSFPAS